MCPSPTPEIALCLVADLLLCQNSCCVSTLRADGSVLLGVGFPGPTWRNSAAFGAGSSLQAHHQRDGETATVR